MMCPLSVCVCVYMCVSADFFSPANVMKLLEVVKGKHTTPETIFACMQLGKRIKKIPVLAGNCFGFIGNRMLEYYGREAFFLVEEGATPAQVCVFVCLCVCTPPLLRCPVLSFPTLVGVCVVRWTRL